MAGSPTQYNNLKKTVQQAQKPTLTVDYITSVFKSFGYRPTAADLHYWTTKEAKTSNQHALASELKKMKDGHEESMQALEQKAAGPQHLTDQEITSLYSKYGLELPNMDWARKNLPDDPKMLENILVQQRKALDQHEKITTQNNLMEYKNSSRPQPQAPQRAQTGAGGYDGAGGPGDTTDFGGYDPLFVHQYSIVKFANDPNGSAEGDASTVWLLDSQNKVLRPFMSMQALQNTFADPQAAMASIITLPVTDLDGPLKGFDLKTGDYGIKDDGTMKPLDVTRTDLQQRYGQTQDTKAETTAFSVLDGFIDLLKQDTNNGISSQYLDKVLGNKDLIAKYINAMAYGSYTPSDVYRDMKRQQAVDAGDTTLANTKIIDGTQNRDTYLNTDEGRTAYTQPTLTPPGNIGDLDTSTLKYSIFQLPDEAFKKLSPTLDINSDQFKQDMTNVQSAFHDILLQQVQAGTDQDKAIADENWKTFKSNLETTYGWKLSDNALQAWKQLETINDTYSNNGIQGSGLQNEAQDDMLRIARENDQRTRYSKLTEEEQKRADYLKASASPAEIAALSDEDKVKYGFKPSADILSTLDLNTLKQKYPDATEEDLKNYVSQIIDENGNYRSTLYQKKFDNDYQVKYGALMGNQLATAGSKTSAQQDQLLNKNLLAEENQMKTFTDPTSEPGGTAWDQPGDKLNIQNTAATPTQTTPAPDEKLNIGNQATTTSGTATTDTRVAPTVPYTQWNPKTNQIMASKAGDKYQGPDWTLWNGGNVKNTINQGGKLYVPASIAAAEIQKTATTKAPTTPTPTTTTPVATPKTTTPASTAQASAAAANISSNLSSGLSNIKSTQTSPVAIPNPSAISNYNVTGTSTDGKTLMGTPKTTTPAPTNPVAPAPVANPYANLTKINDPKQLAKYTESQIVRAPGGAIYLKAGVK